MKKALHYNVSEAEGGAARHFWFFVGACVFFRTVA
jgi:hypothetical protein